MSIASRAAADPADVPAGYHYESRPRTGLLVAGLTTFGVSYGLAVGFAALTTAESTDPYDPVGTYPKKTLYIPFVGPLLQLSATELSPAGNVIFAADAVAQVAGAAMAIAGVAWPTKALTPDLAKVRLDPARVGQAGTGLVLSGGF